MALTKSAGNMYPWVTHTHTHLGGECPHKCVYCYVNKSRFGVSPKYQGNIRIIYEELGVNYGDGKCIFIEHMNDMFAAPVYDWMIDAIMKHCREYPNNKYVFQTKNPAKYIDWYVCMPPDVLLGITLETNEDISKYSQAPSPHDRVNAIRVLKVAHPEAQVFVTIEPIMDFNVHKLHLMIVSMKPAFINIGADSKGNKLPEPPPWKVKRFIELIGESGIEIRCKHNLNRLLEGE